MKAATAILTTLGLVAIAAGLGAQQTGFKRTVLQQSKLSVPGHEAVTAIAEFQPGGTVGQHTHPGEEIGYILEGSIVLEQEGKPPDHADGRTNVFHPERPGAQRHQQGRINRPRPRQLRRRIG